MDNHKYCNQAFEFEMLLDKLMPMSFELNNSGFRPGPEVIKLFSSSTQLSMKFQLLINAEIVKINGKLRFKPQKLVIYPAHKY